MECGKKNQGTQTIDFYEPIDEYSNIISMLTMLAIHLRKGWPNPFDNYAFRENICVHIAKSILGMESIIHVPGRQGSDCMDCENKNYNNGEIKSGAFADKEKLLKVSESYGQCCDIKNEGKSNQYTCVKKSKYYCKTENIKLCGGCKGKKIYKEMEFEQEIPDKKIEVIMKHGPTIDIRSYSQQTEIESYKSDVREKILSWNMFHYIQSSRTQEPLWCIYIFGKDNCKYLCEKYILNDCYKKIIETKGDKKKDARVLIKNFTKNILNENFPIKGLNKMVIMNKNSFKEGEEFDLDTLTEDEFQHKIIEIYS